MGGWVGSLAPWWISTWGTGFSLPGGGGGGGVMELPKTLGGGGLRKRAQLTDTIITIEKKLRSPFWQGICTSDFVPLLGTLQLMWF